MPARFLLTVSLVMALGATAAAAYAQSEPPKGFLHCIGQAANNKGTEHTITIYSKTAIMDGGSEYKLYSSDAFYQLERADFDEMMSWIVINRVTGGYEISVGRTIVQQIKTENGICTKMDRKL